ncbi:beta-galactoside-specific lectin 3-like [Durio zibethinus]|uniref:Ribosome-inactivating protein n=1 Tax=Durio zibethinus TaxID=66656 RepID=A0A6P5YJJ1_DURZI|nr:beta-galactoside-specific lectin 3-like [Durio zibethinus]
MKNGAMKSYGLCERTSQDCTIINLTLVITPRIIDHDNFLVMPPSIFMVDIDCLEKASIQLLKYLVHDNSLHAAGNYYSLVILKRTVILPCPFGYQLGAQYEFLAEIGLEKLLERWILFTFTGKLTLLLVPLTKKGVVVVSSCCISATEKEHNLKIYKPGFTTNGATRNSHMRFMSHLRGISTPTDPEQYLLVELSNGYQTVTLALNISNVYILGYQPGGSGSSYFFRDVPIDARSVFLPNTQRESLPFTGICRALEDAAGVGDRREIPLGIDELRQHIENMNYLQPSSSRRPIARALIICIQMVSEAVRFRNIQQEILAVAEPRADGIYGIFYPDGLLMEYETNWEHISSDIQSATDGIFTRAGRLVYEGQELVLSTLSQVRFIIAIMPLICRNTGANLELLRMPASISSYEFSSLLPMAMRSIGLEDKGDTCEKALAPTLHITGQNGLCVDVYQGSYHNGNKIILWECGQNQANQLWTLRTDDNTIRSGGKCLTTYGYSSGNYVMIYDCDTAVSDATK